MALNCVPRGKGSKVFDWTQLYHDPWGDAPVDNHFTQEQREFIKKRKAKRKTKRGKTK